MRKIYTHENRILVGNVKNVLEGNGVAVVLKNEFVSSAMGEVPVFDAWPELWVVNDDDYSKALQLLEVFNNQKEMPEWTCQQCGESNAGSFELCWQCQFAHR